MPFRPPDFKVLNSSFITALLLDMLVASWPTANEWLSE
jgi:hypothetical protein